MKFSLRWLCEFVEIEAPAQVIADRLTMAGFEVERCERQGEGLDSLVTATLLTREKHPHADRLSLCEVSTRDATYSIVCGADNMKPGDCVVLALPGARLPNGVEIRESVIRNVKSQGMLCSEKELGLAEESQGIMLLPPDTPPGADFAEALGLRDVIFDINIAPNRGDCLSVAGMARELAAALAVPLWPQEVFPSFQTLFSPSEKMTLQVQIQTDGCLRYSGCEIRGVRLGPSPLVVQTRLRACGIRPVNNIVDATHYVMLETGQPLHAFDFHCIRDAVLSVRFAQAGEPIETLDKKRRQLLDSDLVIADAKGPLALAGIMGGNSSAVQNETVDLWLEGACFSPALVRKTAKRLGLQTEASYRFEREVDPQSTLTALQRAAGLIVAWAGGKISAPVDIYRQPRRSRTVSVPVRKIQELLGADIPLAEVSPKLQTLQISAKEDDGLIVCDIPTFRNDLRSEADLIEELARLYGYSNIPTTYPQLSLADMPPPSPSRFDDLRHLLAASGFRETIHYSFTSLSWLKKFGEERATWVTLRNPLSEEMSVLRPSLLPQLVQTLRNNFYHGSENLRLFELRPCYESRSEGSEHVVESWHLALAMQGLHAPVHFLEKPTQVSFFDLKGAVEAVFSAVWGEEKIAWRQTSSKPFFHPKRQCALFWVETGTDGSEAPGLMLGHVGELHPALLEAVGLSTPVIGAEFCLDALSESRKALAQWKPLEGFPSVRRDLNLVVDEEVTHAAIGDVIRHAGSRLLRQVHLFDLYRGVPLAPGKKALTYRMEYGAKDRTLTDEEVNRYQEELLQALSRQVGATLRP